MTLTFTLRVASAPYLPKGMSRDSRLHVTIIKWLVYDPTIKMELQHMRKTVRWYIELLVVKLPR